MKKKQVEAIQELRDWIDCVKTKYELSNTETIRILISITDHLLEYQEYDKE